MRRAARVRETGKRDVSEIMCEDSKYCKKAVKRFFFVQVDTVSLVAPRGLGMCFMPFYYMNFFVFKTFIFLRQGFFELL